MTKNEAHRRAHERWGTPGTGPDDRCGMTCLRSKKVDLRCEVGYHVRDGRVVVMGRGRTWEEAFTDADQRDFDHVWRRLAKDGHCDSFDGAEYRRVKAEWDATGGRGDAEAFITSRTRWAPWHVTHAEDPMPCVDHSRLIDVTGQPQLTEARECEDSPDGRHHFSPDEEYAQKHRLAEGPVCCEFCGEEKS